MPYTEIEVDYDGSVRIDGSHVKEWLAKADKEEVALVLSETDVEGGFSHYLGVNLGAGAANEYDFSQVQALLRELHISDILAKLRA